MLVPLSLNLKVLTGSGVVAASCAVDTRLPSCQRCRAEITLPWRRQGRHAPQEQGGRVLACSAVWGQGAFVLARYGEAELRSPGKMRITTRYRDVSLHLLSAPRRWASRVGLLHVCLCSLGMGMPNLGSSLCHWQCPACSPPHSYILIMVFSETIPSTSRSLSPQLFVLLSPSRGGGAPRDSPAFLTALTRLYMICPLYSPPAPVIRP